MLIDGLLLVSVIVLVLVEDAKLIGESDDLMGLLKSMPSPLHLDGLRNGGSWILFNRGSEGPSFAERRSMNP